ncbi:MAG TPA: hypothetical protein VN622_16165 [Clostridia bacterium]|nr:hypothetical protein [Clostridia bacterium]
MPNASKIAVSTRIFALALLAASIPMLLLPETAFADDSIWVRSKGKGQMIYKELPKGDRIPDFSHAGYMGGGVAIPDVPVKKTLIPSGADDTASIQEALDEIGKMDLVNGARGALLLAPGVFHCSKTIVLQHSGVVLRGSGSMSTILELTGPPHLGLSARGANDVQTVGSPVPIVDDYVPAGSSSFRVKDPSAFGAGDAIQIIRPVTDAWIRFMGMHDLKRNGKKQTWVSGDIRTERVINRISGNTVYVDVPLTDSFDSEYLGVEGTKVVKVIRSGLISQVGIENLRLIAPPQKISLNQPQYSAITMRGAVDSWLRDIEVVDTTNGVSVGEGTKRVTVERVSVIQNVAIVGGAKPADFAVSGSQVLFNRCSGKGDATFYFATQAKVQGPNVILNCTFHGNGRIQPHQRWATGLLIDSCNLPDGGIDLQNRGEMGSGHGWSIGWSVAWNNKAQSFVIQQPPGSMNWSIGNRGEERKIPMPTFGSPKQTETLPQGIVESPGKPVQPNSLYLEQLLRRLGSQALKNIGY